MTIFKDQEDMCEYNYGFKTKKITFQDFDRYLNMNFLISGCTCSNSPYQTVVKHFATGYDITWL